MGGGGSSTSTTSTWSPYSVPLGKLGTGLKNDILPLANELSSQIQSLLTTGIAPGSTVPMINRSTDAARAALSGSMEAARQSAAASGQGNSTVSLSNLANLNMQGNQNVASIGPEQSMNYLSGGLSSVLGLTSPAISALQGAAGYNNTATTVQSENPSFGDIFGQLAGSTFGGVGQGIGQGIGINGLGTTLGNAWGDIAPFIPFFGGGVI